MSLTRRTADLDKAIGSRVRAARKIAGWSQTRLADVLGITFQQVQKYEVGKNRIAASTLMLIAEALAVPLRAFLPARDEGGNGVDELRRNIADGLDQCERAHAAIAEAATAVSAGKALLASANQLAALLPADDPHRAGGR